jgi:hypothetical protein
LCLSCSSVFKYFAIFNLYNYKIREYVNTQCQWDDSLSHMGGPQNLPPPVENKYVLVERKPRNFENLETGLGLVPSLLFTALITIFNCLFSSIFERVVCFNWNHDNFIICQWLLEASLLFLTLGGYLKLNRSNAFYWLFDTGYFDNCRIFWNLQKMLEIQV